MKALILALIVTLSVGTLAVSQASADAPFGTRGWFSERLNGG
jgi:hypothetical protein